MPASVTPPECSACHENMFYLYCSGNCSLKRPTLSINISSIISWRLINVLIKSPCSIAFHPCYTMSWKVCRFPLQLVWITLVPLMILWEGALFFSPSVEYMFHRFYIVLKYLVQQWRKLTGCDWASPPTVNLTSRWCVLDQHFRRHFIGHEDICCHTLTDIWMTWPFHACQRMFIIDSFYWYSGYAYRYHRLILL